MDHTSSFKDGNKKGKKKNHGRVRDALVPFYCFSKMQQQVTSTDGNEPSLQHQLIKPTLNSLVNKVTPASINLRPGGQLAF